jgi:2'-5' RNA ligase
LRLFLAAPLPVPLEADLLTALAPVRRAAAQVRWVRPGQFHLTLAFLSEVPAPEVGALIEAIHPVAARHAGPSLDLSGAGCFGRPHQPEVLYARLAGDLPGLQNLAADVRSVLGVGDDFHPHLTLARARGRHGDAALARCQRALRHLIFGRFTLDRMVLFRSELRSTGPEHTPLAEFPLGTAPAARAGAP